MSNISNGLLHRAFSVFLFNSASQLLVQRRASVKITFPELWANTCCSHPLFIESELLEENELGVKNAAIRKLNQELGIKLDRFKPSDFNFLTRIHYKAESDGVWGEHEIDYILMVRGDVELELNPNEVSEYKWLSRDQIESFMNSHPVTPWFKLVVRNYILEWWQNLSTVQRDEKINRFS
eukprot:TRINITY_DN3629_c0_g1_i2.p1 TRINITY_DN3629_c0_g1~~TRINITY_DN3629_c0_g1_i2.p1  ORF type:complete len:180 (+),score=21.99 TRINITY_DN3629_c0_g1_i2:240-779(+)